VQTFPGQQTCPANEPQLHSQPSVLWPLQSPKLVLHEAQAQLPTLQKTPFAFCTLVVQLPPQLPHFVTSVRKFVSQPVLPTAQ
jgi:hypothetical protein